MFWHEGNEDEQAYRVPEDVFDLVFRLRGSNLDIDHAYALSLALQAHISEPTCHRIGVHGIRLAQSGNGWNRPEQSDAALPLSRRARLIIRVRDEDYDEVAAITDQTLKIGPQPVDVGASSMRKLSSLGTLHARAVCCERDQSEEAFLKQVAQELAAMGIDVSKMICGKSQDVRAGDQSLFTRSLLVADLKPEESVALQKRGIGEGRMLGCGIFVPHKGIDAVHSPQE